MKKLFAFFALVFVVTSCDQYPTDSIIGEETGQLAIKMAVASIPAEVVQVSGMLAKHSMDTIFFDFDIGENQAAASVEAIPAGTWSLRVDARESEGVIAYSGTTEVQITGGEVTSVQLHLSKTGSLEITVSWGDEPTLVAYYPFDGNANDESGNNHHALIYGASLSPDRFGAQSSSYAFNGTDSYMEIPHDPSMDIGGEDFTISLWVRYNTTEGEQVFIEKWIQKWPPVGWTLTKLGGDMIRFACSEKAEFDVDTDPLQIPTDTWHHCALTRDNQTISIYWNGDLIRTEWMEEEFGSDLRSDVAIKLGHRGSPDDTPGSEDTSGFFLNGNLDDIRIYNHSLTAGEIISIYQEEKTGI